MVVAVRWRGDHTLFVRISDRERVLGVGSPTGPYLIGASGILIRGVLEVEPWSQGASPGHMQGSRAARHPRLRSRGYSMGTKGERRLQEGGATRSAARSLSCATGRGMLRARWLRSSAWLAATGGTTRADRLPLRGLYGTCTACLRMLPTYRASLHAGGQPKADISTRHHPRTFPYQFSTVPLDRPRRDPYHCSPSGRGCGCPHRLVA